MAAQQPSPRPPSCLRRPVGAKPPTRKQPLRLSTFPCIVLAVTGFLLLVRLVGDFTAVLSVRTLVVDNQPEVIHQQLTSLPSPGTVQRAGQPSPSEVPP